MLYPTWRIFVLPIYKLWLGKVEGTNNIPKDQPFIMALNHSSYYDTLLMWAILLPRLDKKIHALVSSTYWTIPIVKNVLNHAESVPLYVSKENYSKEKNKKLFKKALEYANNGELLLIFPEGTRSPTGKLLKAKTGVARLALKAKVPVVPVGIKDAWKVLPKGSMLPRLKRCEVHFGRPMRFGKYYGKKANEKTLNEITRSIMKEIAKLIGQQYSY